MLRFGLDVKGLDTTLASLSGLELQIRLNITVELEKFAKTITEIMITQHSFQNRTGRLERSIGYHIEVVPGSLQLFVYALAPYAIAVEEGVEGHSRPYPFFWATFYEFLPDLIDGLGSAVAAAFENARDAGRLPA